MSKLAVRLLSCLFVSTLLAPTWVLADTPEKSESALEHLDKLARAELALAQARCDRHALRLNSLKELKHQGYASFKEVTFAQLQHATYLSQRDASSRLARFVHELVLASNSENPRTGDLAGGSSVVLTIPGLASDPRTRLLSSIPLPNNIDAEKAIAIQAGSDSHPTDARVQAWAALHNRLQASSSGSQSRDKEIAAADLERRIAQAELELASLNGNIVNEFNDLKPFQFNDQTINDVGELLKLVNSEFDRLQYLALRDASQAKTQLLAELEDRVAKADSAGASPPGELTFVRRALANADRRVAVAGKTLRYIERAKNNQNPSQTTFVSHPNGRRPFDAHQIIGLPNVQFEMLQQAMLERLLDASDKVKLAIDRRDLLDQKYAKLSKLAQSDAYFVGELKRLELEFAIARTEVDYAESQHAQRRMELKYVDHLAGSDRQTDPGDWTASLAALFEHLADSTAAQRLAQRTLELDQWRLDGCSKLHDQGLASWKELKMAQVRRDESIARIKQTIADHAIAKAIVEMLRQAGDDPNVSPVEPTS